MSKRNLFDLSGRVAVVTGASRGIGESAARLLAENGAHVVVSSRKEADCEIIAASIREAGGQATAMGCHVGDLAAIEALFKRVEAELGQLDILVNNAAANPYFGPVLDTPLTAYDKTVDVNIRGYFFASAIAGRMMRAGKGGAIVNTASINGVRPGAFQGIYSITKAAVISMTQTFAKECAGNNIRVNAVLPGLTDTKFASALTTNEAVLKQVMPQIPMQRIADPEEIAPAILFLASDAASYITGSCITADGGLLA